MTIQESPEVIDVRGIRQVGNLEMTRLVHD